MAKKMRLHCIVSVLVLCLLQASISLADPCSSPGSYDPATTYPRTIKTPDGRPRTYNFYVPETYTPKSPQSMPVVFVLHGGGGTSKSAEAKYEWNPQSDEDTFLSVYPQGIDYSWNAGDCCGGAMRANIDDVTFIVQALQDLASLMCVNSSRVYATGMSNGAVMTHRLACERADVFAAIAPVEGTIEYFNCTPSRPVPVFEVHGTGDQNIPFNGGHGCAGPTNWTSVPETVNIWTRLNGCSCSYSSNETSDCSKEVIQIDDGTCYSYGPCNPTSDYILCIIDGGGHTWSGGVPPRKPNPNCDQTVGTFPATPQIWNFFSQYST